MGSSSLLNDLRIKAFDYQPLYTTLIAGCVIQSKQQYDTDADGKLTKMAFTHCILIRPGLSFIITENNYLWLAMHEWATSPMSTCYCKSGGVGSNPAQVNMSFAHLKNVWQWIVVLFDEEATQMAKISMPHQGLCIWYRKGQTNFSERIFSISTRFLNSRTTDTPDTAREPWFCALFQAYNSKFLPGLRPGSSLNKHRDLFTSRKGVSRGLRPFAYRVRPN